jgi:hypothetical protein
VWCGWRKSHKCAAAFPKLGRNLEVWIQVSVDDAVLWITKYMYMHKTPGDLDIVTVVIAASRRLSDASLM